MEDKKLNSCRARVLDAEDGSGDGVLVLPDELWKQLGWEVGDKLDIEIGDDNKITLRKLK